MSSSGENNASKFNPIRWSYVIILLVAAGLRFALLGSIPLDDHQANLALQALAQSNGDSITIAGEPGYIALTTILFDIFNASGFWARFWPALFGSFVVLLPLLYQKWLGRSTALVLAALIAFDPVLIGVSKVAGGSMLAMVGLFAAPGFWLVRRYKLSGVFLGVALVGGSNFWPGLLILLVIVIIFGVQLFEPRDREVGHPWSGLLGLVSAAITVLLISTVFLTRPNGISAVGSSLVDSFTSWKTMNVAQNSGNSLAWLLVELPLVILGTWSMVDTLLRKEPAGILLGIWWGLAIILGVLNLGPGSSHFIWASLPMLILAALKLSQLISLHAVENRLVFTVEILLVLAMIVFSFLNLINMVNNSSLTTEDTRNRIIGTFLPLILLALMTVLFSWGWSFSSTRHGFTAGVVILLLVGLLSNAWKSAGLGSRPQFEIFTHAGYPTGTQTLIHTVEDLSHSKTGYANRIDIQVIGLEQPSLLWTLREFKELISDSVLDPGKPSSVVLTDVNTIIDMHASYRGQKILWEIDPGFSAMKPIDWFKWALFRVAPVNKNELILWARNDLFPGALTP